PWSTRSMRMASAAASSGLHPGLNARARATPKAAELPSPLPSGISLCSRAWNAPSKPASRAIATAASRSGNGVWIPPGSSMRVSDAGLLVSADEGQRESGDVGAERQRFRRIQPRPQPARTDDLHLGRCRARGGDASRGGNSPVAQELAESPRLRVASAELLDPRPA